MFRVICHLDMDAFYASVEQRDSPHLRGKPVIVGAPPNQRGVVAAASYEARKFGVRSAMPSVTARRLCPDGIFVRPRMERYRDESERIMAIAAQTGAIVEQVSIDEAYLDLSSVCQDLAADTSLQKAVPLALQLKQRIFTERSLTTSIGIAANMFLAKLGSDFSKPDGLTLIPERDKAAFLRPMSIRVVHGVGRVTEKTLRDAGLATIGDVQDYRGDLRSLVGSFGPALKHFAFGEDERTLETGGEIKSVASETTFLQDTENRGILRHTLREQSADIAERLKQRELGAQTVQVKVRYPNFATLTRQITVEDPLSEASDIYRLGCFLLARERLVCRPLRLIGLAVTSLTTAGNRQLRLPFSGSSGA